MKRFVLPACLSLLLGALGLVLSALAAEQDRDGAARLPALLKPMNPKQRLREGTKFEGIGRFEISGDHATFIPDEGPESFRLLENLALERVARVHGESRQPRQWKISAIVTEFQGANYLLLLRAVVNPAPAKPERKVQS